MVAVRFEFFNSTGLYSSTIVSTPLFFWHGILSFPVFTRFFKYRLLYIAPQLNSFREYDFVKYVLIQRGGLFHESRLESTATSFFCHGYIFERTSVAEGEHRTVSCIPRAGGVALSRIPDNFLFQSRNELTYLGKLGTQNAC